MPEIANVPDDPRDFVESPWQPTIAINITKTVVRAKLSQRGLERSMREPFVPHRASGSHTVSYFFVLSIRTVAPGEGGTQVTKDQAWSAYSWLETMARWGMIGRIGKDTGRPEGSGQPCLSIVFVANVECVKVQELGFIWHGAARSTVAYPKHALF